MDTKLLTFLTLCRELNYRRTAEQMHISQPAVTKQIQQLEQIYGVKLFVYDGRQLKKTEHGRILEQYAASIRYNYRELKQALQQPLPKRSLRIGATKTIGNYVIAQQVAAYLSQPENNLSLVVDNTEHLLHMLNADELDFALIEGVFQREKYQFELFRREPFIGICAVEHPLNGTCVAVEDLFDETLIVREKGSGTRDILQRNLTGAGYSLQSFRKCVSISSFPLIRSLIQKNLGISFVYQSVVGDDPSFGRFTLKDWTFFHEFNIVYLKDTNAGEYVNQFFGERNSALR